MWPKLNPLETKMAKISHTKIKQPSFEEKRPKLTNLHQNFPIYGNNQPWKVLRNLV